MSPSTDSTPDSSATPSAPPTPASTRGDAAQSLGPSWRSRGAWAVLLIVTIVSTAIDLWSKELAFARVAPQAVIVQRDEVIRVKREIDPRAITQELIPAHPPRVVVPNLLHFTLVLNPGAVFGVGPGQRVFFVTFTLAALGFAMFMFARWTHAKDAFAHAALGLLIGGGLGNLYDRLVFACVRDFIHPLPGWNWPLGWAPLGDKAIWPYVSNLADLFLLVGIGMLLVFLWRKDKPAAG